MLLRRRANSGRKVQPSFVLRPCTRIVLYSPTEYQMLKIPVNSYRLLLLCMGLSFHPMSSYLKSVRQDSQMAETVNIAQMAEKLADKIFNEFFWDRIGPTNINWKCESPDVHKVATHPTDIVFFYDEPYSKVRRYIQCDLKSYSKSSFSKGKISDALVSLAKQVACAEISSEWQGKYLVKGTTSEISGLLFVYNHDQEYHKEFGSLIGDLDVTELNLPPKSRLFLLGPDDINWLDRVVHDIKLMRGDEDDERRIPSRDCCAYYYPDLSRKTNVQADRARAATLEMLSSPWIVMQYFVEDSDVRKGVVVFYRRVPTVDGFKYLIDYLRHFQMFEVKSFNIDIRVNFDLGDAKIVFEKAIIEYLDEIAGKNSDTDFAKRLRKIRISAVPQLTTSFSQEQIGMDYGR